MSVGDGSLTWLPVGARRPTRLSVAQRGSGLVLEEASVSSDIVRVRVDAPDERAGADRPVHSARLQPPVLPRRALHNLHLHPLRQPSGLGLRRRRRESPPGHPVRARLHLESLLVLRRAPGSLQRRPGERRRDIRRRHRDRAGAVRLGIRPAPGGAGVVEGRPVALLQGGRRRPLVGEEGGSRRERDDRHHGEGRLPPGGIHRRPAADVLEVGHRAPSGLWPSTGPTRRAWPTSRRWSHPAAGARWRGGSISSAWMWRGGRLKDGQPLLQGPDDG